MQILRICKMRHSNSQEQIRTQNFLKRLDPYKRKMDPKPWKNRSKQVTVNSYWLKSTTLTLSVVNFFGSLPDFDSLKPSCSSRLRRVLLHAGNRLELKECSSLCSSLGTPVVFRLKISWPRATVTAGEGDPPGARIRWSLRAPATAAIASGRV